MSIYSVPQITAIILIFFCAGIVKGIAGMGLPTVAIGLLSTIMTPVTAVTLLVVPSFVTNIWQLYSGPDFKALANRLWPMLLGIVAGTLAGSGVIAGDSSGWTTAALGAALAVYAGLGLLSWHAHVPPRAERALSPLIGVTTGLIAGATGVFVIPAVPYLQALGLFRDDLIQALGLSFTISTIALALGLASHGAFHASDIGGSSLVLIPALIGMEAGQRIRKRISLEAFRRWFLAGLLILGLELVFRSVI
jgi:uncharacterized protein